MLLLLDLLHRLYRYGESMRFCSPFFHSLLLSTFLSGQHRPPFSYFSLPVFLSPRKCHTSTLLSFSLCAAVFPLFFSSHMCHPFTPFAFSLCAAVLPLSFSSCMCHPFTPLSFSLCAAVFSLFFRLLLFCSLSALRR